MHRRGKIILLLFFLLLPGFNTLAFAAASPSLDSLSRLKYGLWPPLLVFALWWLVRGGRPAPGKRVAYPQKIYTIALLGAVLLFGFALGREPNPVGALVAFFPWAAEAPWGSRLLGLLFFSVLALVGTKLICGWGCPFGAVQELLYKIPLFRQSKEIQLPFLITMAVRTLFFLAFLFVVIGGGGLYAHIDPFRLFDGHFGPPAAIFVFLLLLLSLFVYRPFCQIFCPFGWFSWFLERYSLFGIRINRRTCSRCNACANACPLEAARGRLLASPVPADCFSCARCLRGCAAGAIDYGWRLGKRGKRGMRG
ncbi:MAG: 4Fe-4S binding protein [Desulfuromonadales bacterium]